jgi:hypothetical protein
MTNGASLGPTPSTTSEGLSLRPRHRIDGEDAFAETAVHAPGTGWSAADLKEGRPVQAEFATAVVMALKVSAAASQLTAQVWASADKTPAKLQLVDHARLLVARRQVLPTSR